MSFLENGYFLSAEDYQNGTMNRLNEAKVRGGDLYTLATRLDSQKRQAATFAVRSLEVVRRAGVSVIKFNFLDQDLNDHLQATVTMSEGFCGRIPGIVIVEIATQETFEVRQAYIRDHYAESFGGLLSACKELELTK